MNRIAIHGRHDATVALQLGNEYRAIELERVYQKRHFDLYRSEVTPPEIAKLILQLHGTLEFESGALVGNVRDGGVPAGKTQRWSRVLQVDQWEDIVPHHLAHAACGFFQSPFEQALVISYDGGGSDGFFRFFEADRTNGASYLGRDLKLNLGSAYATLAIPIKEIFKPPALTEGESIRNAGKLMGLAAYGRPRPEWIDAFREFYLRSPSEYTRARRERLPELGRQIGLDLTAIRDCIEGPIAYDFAATAQRTFELIFFDMIWPTLRERTLRPGGEFEGIVLVGGCALNVTVNQLLASRVDARRIYVPPNPNDCGLALGALWQRHPPLDRPDVTYAGVPLLDEDNWWTLVTNGVDLIGEPEVPGRVAHQLAARGHVIGVARGNSEHGPRALGNRSILADASLPGLKDRLNASIKFRESFRPYAPVVRKEDAAKYFECGDEDMSYMSFCPKVRPEWRDLLSAITHEDGTARVQTVTRAQNQWLYDLLTDFEFFKKGRPNPHGVLLNTSFNTRGKPILTTAAEAVRNLVETDLDAVLIEDHLITKRERLP